MRLLTLSRPLRDDVHDDFYSIRTINYPLIDPCLVNKYNVWNNHHKLNE